MERQTLKGLLEEFEVMRKQVNTLHQARESRIQYLLDIFVHCDQEEALAELKGRNMYVLPDEWVEAIDRSS